MRRLNSITVGQCLMMNKKATMSKFWLTVAVDGDDRWMNSLTNVDTEADFRIENSDESRQSRCTSIPFQYVQNRCFYRHSLDRKIMRCHQVQSSPWSYYLTELINKINETNFTTRYKCIIDDVIGSNGEEIRILPVFHRRLQLILSLRKT